MDIDIARYAKNLSAEKFESYGLEDFAYMRVVKSDTGNGFDDVYVVCAADGSQISNMDSYETATAAIYLNNLNPVTLN
jgi:hypothetical protein